MRIIYASCLCSKERFNQLSMKSNIPLSQAAQKYNRLLAEGFVANDDVVVETITNLPVARSSYSKIFINRYSERENGVNYNYLPLINIPIIKNIYTIISSFFKTLKLCKQNKKNILICDVLNISVSIGALLASKIKNIDNIGIVTDIPSYLAKDRDTILVKINNYLINSFSSYIFLTDDMSKVIDIKGKNYIVLEGHVDKNMKSIPNSIECKYDKKVCIYAGGLHRIYGIETLTQAFINSNIDNSELHIYGSGDFEDELVEICKNHNNIKYFGVKENDYVVKEQLKATLLINPRPTNEEYTKYSFPSKNMEYMVSGTPVLTTKLPGMPKEYEDYVYIIEDETTEGLARHLCEVLNKPREELHIMGCNAKKFVLEEKNNIVQSKKILKMFEVK